MNTTNDYEKQAEDFLAKHNLVINAEQAVPQTAPNWAKDGKHGIQWSITIAKLTKIPEDIKHRKFSELDSFIEKQIQFFFWSSIKDKEDHERNNPYNRPHKKPTAYAVLANLYNTGLDTLEDFCANYGYDIDSKTAENTYNACIELNAKIESIMTPEAIEELQEIN